MTEAASPAQDPPSGPWARAATAGLLLVGSIAHVVITATTRVSATNDSLDYRDAPGTPALRVDLAHAKDASRGWVRTPAAIVDLLGHGLRPGVLAQAYYSVMPDDRARVVGQGVIAALAWVVVALTLASCLRRPWARVGVVAAVMLASVSPIVTWWDISIAQESLMLSASLVFLAALAALALPGVRLAGVRHGERARWVVLAGALVVATLTRPQSIALLAPLACVGLALTVVERSGFHRLSRELTVRVAAVFGVVLVAGVWAVVDVTNNVHRWEQEHAVERFVDRMGDPGYYEAARDLGMPHCPAMDDLVRTVKQEPMVDTVMLAIATTVDCPALGRWFAAGGLSTTELALHDPGLVLHQYWNALDGIRQYTGIVAAHGNGELRFIAGGKLIVAKLPKPPDPLGTVQKVLWAPAGTAVGVALLLVAVGVVVGVRRFGRRSFAPELVLLGSSVVASALYFAIVWAVPGMEHGRHALPLQLVLAFVVWLVVLRAFGPPRNRVSPAPDRSVTEQRPVPLGSGAD